jgi:hypothetical protein
MHSPQVGVRSAAVGDWGKATRYLRMCVEAHEILYGKEDSRSVAAAKLLRSARNARSGRPVAILAAAEEEGALANSADALDLREQSAKKAAAAAVITSPSSAPSPVNTARTNLSQNELYQQQQQRAEMKESDEPEVLNLEQQLQPDLFDVMVAKELGVIASSSPLSDDGRNYGSPGTEPVSSQIPSQRQPHASMEDKTDEQPPDTSKWRIPDDIDDHKPVRRRAKPPLKSTYQF